jgi:hypothetical protein
MGFPDMRDAARIGAGREVPLASHFGLEAFDLPRHGHALVRNPLTEVRISLFHATVVIANLSGNAREQSEHGSNRAAKKRNEQSPNDVHMPNLRPEPDNRNRPYLGPRPTQLRLAQKAKPRLSGASTRGERGDSNPRPPGPQPGALPTELRPPGTAFNLARAGAPDACLGAGFEAYARSELRRLTPLRMRLPLPVGAVLDPVAADLHLAPGPALVPGAVEEGPTTFVAGADLQP